MNKFMQLCYSFLNYKSICQSFCNFEPFEMKIGWNFPSSGQSKRHEDLKNCDEEIANYCKIYGAYGFAFICYPIGGLERFYQFSDLSALSELFRFYWHPTQLATFFFPLNFYFSAASILPSLHLPDLQMKTNLWFTYVNCCVSKWLVIKQ